MFAATDTGRDILMKRYYAPGETEPEQLLRRVAKYISLPEKEQERWEEIFYDMMHKGLFLPNSPCLHNAGRDNGLFACFVVGLEDDLESISRAKANAMAITKAGGGWGIDIGKLRPRGARVAGSTHGVAGGPIGFLETFSYDMRTMTQGGFRDAACMATMDIDHPDILEFIRAKNPNSSIVRLLNIDKIFPSGEKETTEIAKGLLAISPVIRAASETYLSNFNLSVLINDEFMHGAINGHPDSEFLLDEIAWRAWANGEPGILFIDTIRKRTRYDPDDISATNPCGEQALPPNGSCCLGSINLLAHVTDEGIDHELLEETIANAVRFLDNMISQNVFPTEETRDWSLKNRAIGLGIMGWADTLIELDCPYDSDGALGIARYVGSTLRQGAYEASKKLYKEKGGTSWDGKRNRALLSIAPTGSISLLAGVSPGIEPIFREKTVRVDNTGEHILYHNRSHMPAFRTVETISPEWIIRHVAAFSEYIDNSISYTVNLPKDASVDDVKKYIAMAHETNCNGITFYRNGSRVRQVLNDMDLEKGDKEPPLRKRPQRLEGTTYKYSAHVSNDNVNVYVTVNTDSNGNPWEVFVNTPYIQSPLEIQLLTMATRLSSLALRNSVPIDDLIRQLRKVERQSLLSIPAIIANVLSEYSDLSPLCPDCGKDLVFTGGCNVCRECGYSSCG